MTWSTASYDANQLLAQAADKPLLIAGNILDDLNMRWHVDNTGYSTVGDDSQTGWPASRAADGHGHLGTRGDQVGSRYAHALACSSLLTGPFDSMFLLYDPGTTVGGTAINVQAQRADDEAFTTNVQTLHITAGVASGSGLQRITDLFTTVYTGTGYFRISFSCDAGDDFTSSTPIAYEVIIGTRYQMSKKANRPWEPETMVNSLTRHVSYSGAVSQVARSIGGWRGDFDWQLDNSGGCFNLNDVTTLRSFWTASNYGTDSFVYIEDPGTAPEYARLCRAESSSISMPFQGPYERSFSLPMIEVPPFAGWSG